MVLAGFIVLGAVRANGAEPAGDWPRWRGSDGDNISKETGWLTTWPETGPKVLWKAEVGAGHSAASISGGRLYTMGNIAEKDAEGNPKKDADGKRIYMDTVWCLDANSGQVVWKHAYPCQPSGSYAGPFSTPTVDGKFVYTLSKELNLFCLDALSGKVIWSKNLKDDFGAKKPYYGYACSPLVTGETVIFETGAPDAALIALNKSTGELAWKFGKSAAAGGYCSPTTYKAGEKTCIAMNLLDSAVGLDAVTGAKIWEFASGGTATPVISGDKAFLGNSGLVKLSGPKPELIWPNTNMVIYWCTPVLYKDHLYGFHGADEKGKISDNSKLYRLRCLDFNTGTVKWEKEGFGRGTVMAAGDKLLILSEDGQLVVAEANAEAYKECARAKVLEKDCWNYPVLLAGKIYCRNSKGTLICLDVTGK